MSDESQIQTWDVLKEFGFAPDAEVVYSDIRPGLSFDFGSFKLSASAVMGAYFDNVVLLTGVLMTPRRLKEVQFEMPRQIESLEKCAAWLAWQLDRAAGGVFKPGIIAPWLETGRAHLHLLPWYVDRAANDVDRAAYEGRPHCSVDRDWARPLLKKLKAALEHTPEGEVVWFSFDGEILRIRFGIVQLATVAEGRAWAERFGVIAEQLKSLPARLMQPRVCVAIWNGRLSLDRRRYEVVVTEKPAVDASQRNDMPADS